MTDICQIDECEREVFEDFNQCILHCKKKAYSEDFRRGAILKEFYNELIQYICDEYRSSLLDGTFLFEDQFKDMLKNKSLVDDTNDQLKKTVVFFDQIFFPARKGIDSFDYEVVLQKLGKIHFHFCKFTAYSLELSDSETFYDECEFFQSWLISPSKLLFNVNNILFQACSFQGNVGLLIEDEGSNIWDLPLFHDCKFQKSIEFEDVNFASKIFNNSDDHSQEVGKIILNKCYLQSDFILNNLVSECFFIQGSSFESKFEIKKSLILDLDFLTTNFIGLFDAYSTAYGSFNFSDLVFSNIVSFESCNFALLTSDEEAREAAVFKNVTFSEFIDFRNTTFWGGLDLESAIFKGTPNFLKITLVSNNTNRETLRIIKYSFDRIGNQIEANKFFVKEMAKYREELDSNSSRQEKFIFWLNHKISNFGQSYILPVAWIISFSVLFQFLAMGYESNFLYQIYEPLNPFLSDFSSVLNALAKNIIPFSKFLKDGMEFISLVFYIVFASLIWQTIAAIKRHTKR